jgi:hypothetical protein
VLFGGVAIPFWQENAAKWEIASPHCPERSAGKPARNDICTVENYSTELDYIYPILSWGLSNQSDFCHVFLKYCHSPNKMAQITKNPASFHFFFFSLETGIL